MEVSDPTLEYDREVKKAIYAEAEIAEFWLVNLKDNTVETFTNLSNGTYYQMQILNAARFFNQELFHFDYRNK
jgi:Uma2 family endonuclease